MKQSSDSVHIRVTTVREPTDKKRKEQSERFVLKNDINIAKGQS